MTRAAHRARHAEAESEAINKLLFAYNTGSHRYIEEFFHLNKSAADMLMLGVFPDAKEVTESYAAFNAVRNKLKFDLSDPHVTAISVGDGHTPRTATLMAFRTNWKCISLDPGLDEKRIPIWESKVDRLTCLKKAVEDVNMDFDKVVILCVHSHADIHSTLDHIKGKSRALVGIPCCVSYDYEIEPDYDYLDAGIWSPKNNVKVWRSI